MLQCCRNIAEMLYLLYSVLYRVIYELTVTDFGFDIGQETISVNPADFFS